METMGIIYDRIQDEPKDRKGYMSMAQEHFALAISLGEPYSQFATTVQRRFSSTLEQHLKILRARVKDVFETLLEDFNDLFGGREHDITDPDEIAFRQEVYQYVVNAKKRLDGPIAQDFAESGLDTSSASQTRVKRERSP